jgi:hypothetical protein
MPSHHVVATRANSRRIGFLIRGCRHEQRGRGQLEGITLIVCLAAPRWKIRVGRIQHGGKFYPMLKRKIHFIEQ